MQVELSCRNKRKLQLQPLQVLNVRSSAGWYHYCSNRSITRTCDVYANVTLELKNVIAVLPSCTIRNLFTQDRITYYPYYRGQTSSSPFEISAHFLFNRGVPGKTNTPLLTSIHVQLWPLGGGRCCTFREALFDGKPLVETCRSQLLKCPVRINFPWKWTWLNFEFHGSVKWLIYL